MARKNPDTALPATVGELLAAPHPDWLPALGGSAFLRRLLAHRLNVRQSRLLAESQLPLAPVAERLHQDFHALSRGCPAGYLFGETGFLEWDFACDDRALCPREETAWLVDWVRRNVSQAPARILDLGCGSGVMGLSLALHFGQSQVCLVDLCPKSLALTRENIERHKLSARTRLLASDWWNALGTEVFDLVVANPPYVAQDDAVQPGVLAFEPHSALFSADQGSADIKTILASLDSHLAPGGLAALECGHRHHQVLSSFLDRLPNEWQWVQDPFGVPRYLIVRKEI